MVVYPKKTYIGMDFKLINTELEQEFDLCEEIHSYRDISVVKINSKEYFSVNEIGIVHYNIKSSNVSNYLGKIENIFQKQIPEFRLEYYGSSNEELEELLNKLKEKRIHKESV